MPNQTVPEADGQTLPVNNNAEPADDAAQRGAPDVADAVDRDEPTEGDGSGGDSGDGSEPTKKKRRRRRRRRSKKTAGEGAEAANAGDDADDAGDDADVPAPPSLDTEPDPELDDRDNAPPDDHKPLNPDTFATDITFADLGLHTSIVRGVTDCGFRHPTHIQARLIPAFLTGRDLLGQAKTGTGKTAAFALPLLHMVERGVWGQALILAPTRELAMQITTEFTKLGKHMPVRTVPIYGGQSIRTQADKLQRGAEILVGTPGRIQDMMQRGLIDPREIRFAVLDEVDRMLDIGFREDIRRILKQTPDDRQTVMVSATIRPDIEDLARRYMHDAEKLVTTAGALTVDLVEQHYLSVDGWDKKRLLNHLLTHEAPALTLVFCRLKRTVDELSTYLNRHGIEAHAIHGDMSQ
ncbi:MAG: DEAD/DEAH box helicase, partial [Phycisphaerales bacterium]|nr:DEAD/DEAH box helicase [Phycisphaerales bacterium]